MRINWLAGLILLSVVISGCRRYNTQQKEQGAVPQLQEKETLVRINQQLVLKDAQEIESWCKQENRQMQTTDSGLWYAIYEKGTGEKAISGKIVALAYTVSLLDSTVCYSSDQSGPKKFRLGQGGVEAGLEEGVLLLHVGDKAHFVMPPHLAHGITGDGDCIPRRTTIVYDVELLSLQ